DEGAGEELGEGAQHLPDPGKEPGCVAEEPPREQEGEEARGGQQGLDAAASPARIGPVRPSSCRGEREGRQGPTTCSSVAVGSFFGTASSMPWSTIRSR